MRMILILTVMSLSMVAIAETRDAATADLDQAEIKVRRLPTKVIDSKAEPMSPELAQALATRANPVEQVELEFDNIEF